ncbi:hypothetical protein Suden_0702 [Sulfurimonas denitrificans DSM 1251]|nr:hypothetical protein Suden_0702 [Sulfurimonas denitrificans DSM 1251]
MMRYKYKVGHIYTDGEHVGQNKTLLKGEFTVNENIDVNLVRLSTVLSEEEAKNIIDYEDVAKYLLRQYAHVEVQDECTLIIPCYTIANRFYFLSSSMKHAIMSETLGELYYEGSFHNEKNAKGETVIKLHIKKKAGKKDLPFLCRFIGNSFARARLEYISNQKSLSASFEYQQIKAQFPVKNPFEIYASYIYLGDDERGNPKYLVLNIHSDNSALGFEELYYKQFSAKADPRDIGPEQYNIPKPPKKKFKRKKPQRSNKIYTGTPSSEYLTYIIRTNEDEYYKNKVPMHETTIYLENESELLVDNIPKTVGNSFETPTADGDKNLGEVAISNDSEENNTEKKIFNLENFYQFYEALLTFAFVEGSELVGPLKIKKIQNKKRKSTKSRSLLHGDEDKQRRFLFGELAYDQKAVYIVEIEQDSSWGPSTWIFFTSEDTEPYTEHDMQEIIEHYIEEDLPYKDLARYVEKNYSLSFEQKEHKKGDVDDDSVERWCESVLKKIIL